MLCTLRTTRNFFGPTLWPCMHSSRKRLILAPNQPPPSRRPRKPREGRLLPQEEDREKQKSLLQKKWEIFTLCIFPYSFERTFFVIQARFFRVAIILRQRVAEREHVLPVSFAATAEKANKEIAADCRAATETPYFCESTLTEERAPSFCSS